MKKSKAKPSSLDKTKALLQVSQAAAMLFLPLVVAASPTRTPEQEFKAIADRLRPIDDDRWKDIAGTKITETYNIVKGDTLWDISKRLFGDPKYWPKIWALNSDDITNPHLILPGHAIAFSPGTGTSLPAVSINDANGNPGKPSQTQTSSSSKRRSQDWRNLPKQRWESVQFTVPPQVDPLGFDTRNKVSFKSPNLIDPEFIVTSQPVDPLGTIKGARVEGDSMNIEDTVYIGDGKNLQVGETYSLVSLPQKFDSPNLDRTGYAYQIVGKVKLFSVKDNLYLGTIKAGAELIPRGTALIAFVPPIKQLTPIPAKEMMAGTLFIDHNTSTFTTAQNHVVFIDRGSQDGIQPGNVFRAYEHVDPNTGNKLTEADYIIDADIMVLSVSEKYCTGMVINSLSLLQEGSPVVALTDVSDVFKHKTFNENGASAPPQSQPPSELDQLEGLDKTEGLGTQEEKELKQLETWKGNPAGPDAAPSPSPSPGASPSDQPPPPSDLPLAPGDEPPPPPPDEQAPPPPADTPPSDALPPADAPPPPADSGSSSSTPPTAPSDDLPPPPQ